ncbi:hypothetical protein Q3V94_08435 [Caloramator sp. CAR-1]|uniref:hypothetical protein n=1 Tax=Caloramator sp. CAR-1 TaxID=3062777 RepID=UPI0026E31DA6|nr:hypothetical protein [Caloramator sp. CAR-1]MDO6355104.1 hypothetical protein [Caloramator sp. CAR-1]
MIKKFQYTTKEERERIIQENQNLVLIEEQNIIDGNFLLFSDNPQEDRPKAQIVYTNVSKEELDAIKQALDDIILKGGAL